VLEVGDAHDGGRCSPGGRRHPGADIERDPLSPAGEHRGGEQRIQGRGELATIAAREECIDSEPVSDEIWRDAASHYGESALAALVLAIGLINSFDGVNVTARQVTGPLIEQHIGGWEQPAGGAVTIYVFAIDVGAPGHHVTTTPATSSS
jgi:hypothetical protein